MALQTPLTHSLRRATLQRSCCPNSPISSGRATSVTPPSRHYCATVLPMAARFICAICELPEEKCLCDKYCCICMGSHDVRLVQDGQYYCLECREVCDFAAQVE